MLEISLSALSGSSRLLALHKKSVIEQGFFHEFTFDNKALKTFDEFRIVENVRSSNVVEFEFELRHTSKSYSASETFALSHDVSH